MGAMGEMGAMGGMGAMGSNGGSALLGGDPGDVTYPYYVINGRIPEAPTTFRAKPGQRIRIRFINAGSDTAFRVALAGHRMKVTHTDGFPIVPTDVDALLIGMGERYDVIVTAADGVFPVVASAKTSDRPCAARDGGRHRAAGRVRAAGTQREGRHHRPVRGSRRGAGEIGQNQTLRWWLT